jgi:hypothetical protein
MLLLPLLLQLHLTLALMSHVTAMHQLAADEVGTEAEWDKEHAGSCPVIGDAVTAKAMVAKCLKEHVEQHGRDLHLLYLVPHDLSKRQHKALRKALKNDARAGFTIDLTKLYSYKCGR